MYGPEYLGPKKSRVKWETRSSNQQHYGLQAGALSQIHLCLQVMVDHSASHLATHLPSPAGVRLNRFLLAFCIQPGPGHSVLAEDPVENTIYQQSSGCKATAPINDHRLQSRSPGFSSGLHWAWMPTLRCWILPWRYSFLQGCLPA